MNDTTSVTASAIVRPGTQVRAGRSNDHEVAGLGHVVIGGGASNVMLIGSLVDIRRVLVDALAALDTLCMEHYRDMAAEVAAS